MPEGPCWSRSARASRSTMSIPRRSPRTVRIATPTAGRLYWTRSGAACSSSLYRIRREFRHRKTSWKDWLEPWPEHCRSEPRLACPTTAIQATTRNPRKTSGTTEGAAKLCCGVPGRQASRGGRQRRAAAPRDAPPQFRHSRDASTLRHHQDTVRPLLIGPKMYPSLLPPPHSRLPAAHSFRFPRHNRRISFPFRTRTLITLRTHKLPRLCTCANSTTTYARVGCTSAEFREQVDDVPMGETSAVRKTTVPLGITTQEDRLRSNFAQCCSVPEESERKTGARQRATAIARLSPL